jgi:hypothetical protein
MKNYTKQLILTTQSNLKFIHFRRNTIVGEIITYIEVRVRISVVLSRSSLTCSGYDHLDVLLLVIPEAILLLVVILVRVVVLLPFGVVGDDVVGVTIIEAVPGVLRASSPLLPKLVHHSKFSYK